jgi:protein SCO1
MRMSSLVFVFLGVSGVLAVPSDSPLADIGPAPAIKLTDSAGKPFDLEKLRGKCVLVSFVFTTCNGTCPLTSRAMAECRDALKDAHLWGNRIEFVSITLDPAHDTPEVLKAYSGIYDADPKTWHFVTGSSREVDRVVSAWGMWARRNGSGVLDHPSRVFLIDPKGRQREIYSLEFLKLEAVVKDIRGLLNEAKRQ